MGLMDSMDFRVRGSGGERNRGRGNWRTGSIAKRGGFTEAFWVREKAIVVEAVVEGFRRSLIRIA